MKKMLMAALAAAALAGAGFAEGKQESAAKAERTVVNFWYLWTGATGQLMEERIAEFNRSQDRYEVKGLSVPDIQKIMVAIASGNGPDVSDDFSSNVASYAAKGILLDLDPYIAKTKYDVKDFIPAALDSCRYQKTTYALPLNATFMMMFYNKKLFAEAGLKEPPKTDKELLEYAIKLTKTNADGSLATLGFPDYPVIYYFNDMSSAMGGDFVSADGKTLTPDNPGSLRALKTIVDYRKKFGVENVVRFQSSGGYLAPTDPFIAGKQAIRIDGPWFGTTVFDELKIKDLDYGVAPLPYPEGKPELAGGGLVSSSVFYIPSNSNNKDGAWAFMSWMLARDNMVTLTSRMGNFPSRGSALTDPAFEKVPDFKAFAAQAKSKNLKVFPAFAGQAEYTKVMGDEAELAMNMKKTPEEALAAMRAQSKGLLEQ